MLSAKFYEGLEAVLYVALNAGASPVSSKDICASQGQLPRHLEPILQLFVKNGILKGTKGPRGGYALAREKRKINLAELYSIFEEGFVSKGKASALKKNIIKPIYSEIEKINLAFMENITVEDLCRDAVAAGGGEKESENFNI